jgi:radical SAM protein with 4Fe4S-binding SPASM domain
MGFAEKQREAGGLPAQVHEHEVGAGVVAVWNRFSPCVYTVSNEVLQVLRRGDAAGQLDEASREALATAGVLDGSCAASKEDAFFFSLDAALAHVDELADSFYAERQPYANLYLVNLGCNLGCRYCVASHSRGGGERHKGKVAPHAKRLEAVLNVVDQYAARRVEAHAEPVTVSFNGGEFLLHWDVLRRVVERIKERHPGVKTEFFLNSNMTLMTPDRAAFLAENDFEVHVSFDGYRDLHDRTRVYRDGRGSYRDVLAGVKEFNSRKPTKPIVGFQGTIDVAEGFDAEALFRMSRHGFIEARLAPNLLGVSEADAEAKADLMIELYEKGQRRKLKFTDTYFVNIRQLMKIEEFKFYFTCAGLAGFPTRGLALNVDTLEMSQLCSYVPEAAVPYDEIGGDIYNRRLWERARAYIRHRAQQLRTVCRQCDVVGVCRGSCLLMGLDAHNRINPAACAYQRRLWRRVLEFAYRRASKTARAQRKSTPEP